MKFCEKCGKELSDEAVVCIGCGCPVASEEQTVEYEYIEEAESKTASASGASIAALIMGIVGCAFPLLGIVVSFLFGDFITVVLGIVCIALSVVGLILAIKARKDNKKNGVALGALITSIAGLVLSAFSTLVYVITMIINTIITVLLVLLVVFMYIGIPMLNVFGSMFLA